MGQFSHRIRPYVDAELDASRAAEAAGFEAAAFSHLERAHVLGQASTWQHVRVHVLMLRWGWRHHQPREVLWQVPRILAAATKTAIGWVPEGNTGGSNVNPMTRMPIPGDLGEILRIARS